MTLDKLRLAILGDAAHPDVNRWCSGLTTAGADVHLISINAHNAIFEPRYIIRREGIPYKLHYILSAWHVRQLLKKIQPDVLICFDITGYGMLGLLSGFHPIVPLTAGSDILLQADEFVMGQIVKRVIKNADIIATLAPHMAEAAYRHGASPNKTHIIPLGIDLSKFAPRDFDTSKTMKIVSTRGLKPFYNLPSVIEAAHQLIQRGIDCQLTIAGHGPQKEELIQLVDTLGISQAVDFVGFIPNADLPPLLWEHQYYVSLSPSDGVSSSLLEAMAIGLFPIVPQHPANTHWVTHNENGILVNELTADALANALQSVHENQTLRKQAYQQNLEIVRDRGDIHDNTTRYVVLFKDLISTYRNQSGQ